MISILTTWMYKIKSYRWKICRQDMDTIGIALFDFKSSHSVCLEQSFLSAEYIHSTAEQPVSIHR